MKRRTMGIKILSEKENPLLKRKELCFQIEHAQTGTPSRLEIRKAIAKISKTDTDLVYVQKLETKTGGFTAVGTANVYDSVEQAKFVEPDHILKRNVLMEKPEEKAEEKIENNEAKEQNV
jgi:small subunit ribosomal protein S24e